MVRMICHTRPWWTGDLKPQCETYQGPESTGQKKSRVFDAGPLGE